MTINDSNIWVTIEGKRRVFSTFAKFVSEDSSSNSDFGTNTQSAKSSKIPQSKASKNFKSLQDAAKRPYLNS